MHVITKGRLRDFWLEAGRQDAAEPLQVWFALAEKATWANWAELQSDYPRADWVGNDRVVFDIGGNKYRLVVKMEFAKQQIYIRFIGTHGQYQRLKDISTI